MDGVGEDGIDEKELSGGEREVLMLWPDDHQAQRPWATWSRSRSRSYTGLGRMRVSHGSGHRPLVRIDVMAPRY